MLDPEAQAQVFDFEGVEDGLPLLPLAARRALDVAGFRLSLEGWQSLTFDDRRTLVLEGGRDAVDSPAVERVVRRSMLPATRIRPVPDPDPLQPPDQLATAFARRRTVAPTQWTKLRALDRYALVHVLRRAVAHDDPERLEQALDAIVPSGGGGPRRSAPPDAPHTQPSETQANPKRNGTQPARGDAGRDAITALDSPLPAPAVKVPSIPAPPKAPAGADRFDALEVDLEASEQFVRRLSTMPPGAADDVSLLASEPESLRPADLAARRLGGSAPPRAAAPESPPRQKEAPRAAAEPPRAADPPAPQVSTHLTAGNEARMVDVGEKEASERRATATGIVRMRKETAQKMARLEGPKGEVLSVARLAGIMAAKRTPDLVPLCHSVKLTKVEVHVDVEALTGIVTVMAIAEARDRTGVEMEALTAVSVACLTIYDMLKGIDRDMTISDIKLVQKSGGRGGSYQRKE